MNVTAEVAVMSREYLLIVVVLVAYDLQGVALVVSFKTMVMNQVSAALPAIVTSSAVSQWTMIMTLINLSTRIFSGWLCDSISPRNTYRFFSVLVLPLALLLPSVVY